MDNNKEYGRVVIAMGSKNDFETVKPAIMVLKQFGVDVSARVLSAHRTPQKAHELSANAHLEGVDILIGVAGKAAHLAGVLASNSPLPIIALPVKTSDLGGLDSLLSSVQMPSGIPVACVAINGAENAGLLAVQMLQLKYPELTQKILDYKKNMAQRILADDEQISAQAQLL